MNDPKPVLSADAMVMALQLDQREPTAGARQLTIEEVHDEMVAVLTRGRAYLANAHAAQCEVFNMSCNTVMADYRLDYERRRDTLEREDEPYIDDEHELNMEHMAHTKRVFHQMQRMQAQEFYNMIADSFAAAFADAHDPLQLLAFDDTIAHPNFADEFDNEFAVETHDTLQQLQDG